MKRFSRISIPGLTGKSLAAIALVTGLSLSLNALAAEPKSQRRTGTQTAVARDNAGAAPTRANVADVQRPDTGSGDSSDAAKKSQYDKIKGKLEAENKELQEQRPIKGGATASTSDVTIKKGEFTNSAAAVDKVLKSGSVIDTNVPGNSVD